MFWRTKFTSHTSPDGQCMLYFGHQNSFPACPAICLIVQLGDLPKFFWFLRQWKTALRLQYVWYLSVRTMPPVPRTTTFMHLSFNLYQLVLTGLQRPGCLTLVSLSSRNVFVSPSLSSLQLIKFQKPCLTILTLFSYSRFPVSFVNFHVSDSTAACPGDGCIALDGSQAPLDVDFWPGRHD